MKIRWYGQSAFLLTGSEGRVFVDPFGEMPALRERGVTFYPPVRDVEADVLLVTHDHGDHNAVEAVGGDPVVVRKAGTHDTPVGEVVGIASEHDSVAGTQRGPNTIFRFALDRLTVAHFGDFGQPALRPEQREALGRVDVALFPVGGGPTTAVPETVRLLRELEPLVVVPMHYRTSYFDVPFVDPPEPFLEALGWPLEEAPGAEAEVEPGAEPRVLKLTLT